MEHDSRWIGIHCHGPGMISTTATGRSQLTDIQTVEAGLPDSAHVAKTRPMSDSEASVFDSARVFEYACVTDSAWVRGRMPR